MKNLLFEFADSPYANTARAIAFAVADNFDKLPPDVRNQLLLNLADYNDYEISKIVSLHIDKLPENIIGFLSRLADNNARAGAVVSALYNNFDKLPENMRNQLLFKLASNKCGDVASVLAFYYDKLPPNVQKLLCRLASNKETTDAVAYAVSLHFDKLPECKE